MTKNRLHSLEFDSAGSATIRYFGSISKTAVHWVDCSLPMLRMICPNTLLENNDNSKIEIPDDAPMDSLVASKNKSCKFCSVHKFAVSAPRMIAMGWDCRQKKWALYLGPENVFADIMKQCNELGISAKMMAEGSGPDIILQRIGFGTDVVLVPESIGEKRGDKEMPSFEECLKKIAANSIWMDYENQEQVRNLFQKSNHQKSSNLDAWKEFSGVSYPGYTFPKKEGNL